MSRRAGMASSRSSPRAAGSPMGTCTPGPTDWATCCGGPVFVWSFWGALKIGAVPVPTNTLLKPHDYEYILRDSRASVVIASEPLVGAVEEVRSRSDLTHVLVVGRPAVGQLSFAELVG